MYVLQATVPDSFTRQGCFAIDYDFSTHKCFFFANNLVVTFSTPLANPAVVTPVLIYLHCPVQAQRSPSSLGTRPNPNVIHITFCKFLSLCLSDVCVLCSFSIHSNHIFLSRSAELESLQNVCLWVFGSTTELISN